MWRVFNWLFGRSGAPNQPPQELPSSSIADHFAIPRAPRREEPPALAVRKAVPKAAGEPAPRPDKVYKAGPAILEKLCINGQIAAQDPAVLYWLGVGGRILFFCTQRSEEHLEVEIEGERSVIYGEHFEWLGKSARAISVQPVEGVIVDYKHLYLLLLPAQSLGVLPAGRQEAVPHGGQAAE